MQVGNTVSGLEPFGIPPKAPAMTTGHLRAVWVLALLVSAAACAQGPASPEEGPASASASAPVAAPDHAGAVEASDSAAETPDLVRELLSLDELEEHTRFLVASKDGNELNEAAYNENRRHRNPFARRYDRWANLLLFDRDGSGTIRWQEALQYRAALRKAILAVYDAGHDGQLTGEERSAANKALAEGDLPPLKRSKPSTAATEESESTSAPSKGPADSGPARAHPAPEAASGPSEESEE